LAHKYILINTIKIHKTFKLYMPEARNCTQSPLMANDSSITAPIYTPSKKCILKKQNCIERRGQELIT
jgi:hypothetical protein